ncbi:MAG: hypothetical protein Q8Q03_02095, partial [bacterium]|nr:hypothetical protein [bacterium]
MNYEPLISRNGRYRNFFPFSLKIVLSAAVILFALYFFAPQALSSFFTMIASPFWTIGKSDEQNKPIFYAGVVALQKENEELKELFGRTEKSDKLLAVILKKPPVSAYDVFILDIGDDKGLKKGDRVYARGDILIGEIAEVNGRTSKAKLYSSS